MGTRVYVMWASPSGTASPCACDTVCPAGCAPRVHPGTCGPGVMHGVGGCPCMCNAEPPYNAMGGCTPPALGPICSQSWAPSCSGAGAWHGQG